MNLPNKGSSLERVSAGLLWRRRTDHDLFNRHRASKNWRSLWTCTTSTRRCRRARRARSIFTTFQSCAGDWAQFLTRMSGGTSWRWRCSRGLLLQSSGRYLRYKESSWVKWQKECIRRGTRVTYYLELRTGDGEGKMQFKGTITPIFAISWVMESPWQEEFRKRILLERVFWPRYAPSNFCRMPYLSE